MKSTQIPVLSSLVIALVCSLNAGEPITNSNSPPNDNTSQMENLQNGAQAPKLDDNSVTKLLHHLSKRHPEAFKDLVMKAHDPSYKLTGREIKKFSRIGLMTPDGNFAPFVQDIITSHTQIQNNEVQFIGPK